MPDLTNSFEQRLQMADLQEGLLLCMVLCASMDRASLPDELREITRIASREPEFQDDAGGEFETALGRVQQDLHRDPNDLMRLINSKLPQAGQRRRGLELAVRVATADGIVSPAQRALLHRLCEGLGLQPETLEGEVLANQRRLVRFMMLYLVYLTATADGDMHPDEFERMIPAALSSPAFAGVSTQEFAAMTQAVRHQLERMRGDKGLDYICGVLKNASDLLNEPAIPREALSLVVRGIVADRQLRESERVFFLNIAGKLAMGREQAEDLLMRTLEKINER